MRLIIKDVGPIREAELELGDITVLVGPSNTGKSTALKSIFYSLNLSRLEEYVDEDDFNMEGLDINELINRGRTIVNLRISKNHIINAYRKYVKSALPGIDFKLYPINVEDFIRKISLRIELNEEYTIPRLEIFLPAECDKERRQIRRVTISLRGEINGKTELYMRNTLNLSDECRSKLADQLSFLVRRTIYKYLVKKLEDYINNGIRNELEQREGITKVIFKSYTSSLNLYNAISWMEPRRRTLTEVYNEMDIRHNRLPIDRMPEPDADILRMAAPLFGNSLVNTNRGLRYVVNGSPIPWNYVSASVIELTSMALLIKRNSLILIEEPETQLHESLQLLVAFFLYALTTKGVKIVLTTHSTTIAYALAHLYMLRPKKEEAAELFDEIGLSNYNDLAEAAAMSKANVKFYYFNNGKAEEKRADEVAAGLPGTQDVLEKELRWYSALYSNRMHEE
ncbi:AAA family ATPase [Thermocladium modestius]|nr:AAA family ATPase [Thermocladium modestius]